MKDEKPWTKVRVLRAYREWRALQDHAEDVTQRWEKAAGAGRGTFERLMLPGWLGSGWPGEDFEYLTTDYNTWEEHGERLPFLYLWTDAWEVKLKAEHDAWKATAEAAAIERRERAQLAELQAKYAELVAK